MALVIVETAIFVEPGLMYRPLDVLLTSGMGCWYTDFDRETLTKLDNKRSVARRASKNAEMRYFFCPLDNMIIIKTYYGGFEKRC